MSADPSAYIYLDYAASAPLGEEARSAMEPYLVAGLPGIMAGTNPNSLSSPGRNAFKALEEARRDIARALGAGRSDEIVFTSGATEADNAAIAGIARAVRAERRRADKGFAGHIVTSAIEHDAVLASAKAMEREGFRVTVLPCDRDGFVEVRALEEAIDEDTVLVSVQMANSEVGSIQPVRQLAAVSHAHGVPFHTDATQALGKIPVDVAGLNVDAASFSAHKIGGPKGIGALYLKARTPFTPQMAGGGQEGGRRSGTQNVCGAVGFAAACKTSVCSAEAENARLMVLRDKLYRDLAAFEPVQATVEVEEGSLDYLPNIVNVMVAGLESQTMVLRLDALGFAVSGGSACSSKSLDPSHVLSALGVRPDDALSELRISLGRYTTEDDIDALLRAVPKMLDWR